MSSPSYLNRLLERVVAAEKRSVASVVAVDAVPYFFHHQEAFPYFTNRIGDNVPDAESPADLHGRVYTVTARLVVAHLGTGYSGEYEALLYDLIPLVETEFERDFWLLDDSGNAIPELSAVGVQFTRSRGLTVFTNAGIDVQQIGTEFTLQAEFAIDTDWRLS